MNKRQVIFAVLCLSLAAILFLGCQSKEVTSAKVYQQQGNWDKMIEQLEQAVQLYPKDVEALYLLGSAYAQKSDWERMSANFDKSLAIAPTFGPQIKNERDKNWVTAFNAGVAKINAKEGKEPDINGAIQQFTTCTVIDPKRVDAYRNLAVTYMRGNNLEAAKTSYEKLLAVDSKNSGAMIEVARLCMQMKDYKSAIQMSQKALDLAPEKVDAVVNLAMAYDLNGDREKALAEYEKAIAKNPNDGDLLFNMARLYFNTGDYDHAVQMFQKVITQNPDDYDANVNVGNAYLNMAEEVRKKLVEKEKSKQTINESEMAELKGFYKESIPYLEKALGIKTENATVWYNLGVAYVNIGNAEKGQQCFDKAESLRK
jgi:tetratricopeptide (TPR) repeat protein